MPFKLDVSLALAVKLKGLEQSERGEILVCADGANRDGAEVAQFFCGQGAGGDGALDLVKRDHLGNAPSGYGRQSSADSHPEPVV